MDDADYPVQLRQLRAYLNRTYASLIDVADLGHQPPQGRDVGFLARALAAQAASILTGITPEEAAATVVDGPGDMGIDAIAVSATGRDIWFIQAKWSNTGRARLSEQDAITLIAGLQQLADRRYGGFNARIHALSNRIDEALSSPRCRVHLVAALNGDGRLTSETEERLNRVGEQFGFADRVPVTVQTLGLADFHSAARLTDTPVPVRIQATLTDGWHAIQMPYPAWVGAVQAGELASWYDSYRSRLFDPGMRPPSAEQADQATVNRLVAEPEEFRYLSNGITLVCDRVTSHYFARRAPGQPVRLELDNARVVKGAQTVACVAEAVDRAPEVGEQALVPLRVICLDDASGDLVAKISQAAERESQSDPLDYVALDPNQRAIRNEFMHFLGKEYVFKNGAVAPAPDAGCTVMEAALALACADPDVSLATRAGADPAYLWRPSPEGAYSRLFGRRPNVRQLWQSVLFLRQVRTALSAAAADESPRVREILEHGELLVAHLLFQDIGSEALEDNDGTADSAWVAQRTLHIAILLASTVEHFYGQHVFLAGVFADERKCHVLAEAVSRSLTVPSQMAPPYTPGVRRRPNSVTVLIDHGRIPDGTRLMYRPNAIEERALGDWLSEDPTRYLATWTNHPRQPLIWAVDGQAYSPSALVNRIWREARWDEAPSAVQGTRCWVIPGEGSLADIAATLTPPAGGDGAA
ncbi:AIPR family protein [Streptomyces sp. NPDC055059]